MKAKAEPTRVEVERGDCLVNDALDKAEAEVELIKKITYHAYHRAHLRGVQISEGKRRRSEGVGGVQAVNRVCEAETDGSRH